MDTPMPTLGAMIDQYYTARAARLAAAKEVDVLQEKERIAEQILLDVLRAQGLEGGKGNVAVAAIKRTTKPNVTDKDAFLNDMFARKDFAMLQFRPSITRLKELADAGEPLVGAELFEEESISLTKIPVRK